MTGSKRQIIRSMTIEEVSSVDKPAQKGAVAVIFKRDGEAPMDIRKNASAVTWSEEQPQFTPTEYGKEIMKRAEELGAELGISSGQVLLRHASTDPVLCELACAERTAESVKLSKKAQNQCPHLDAL